MKSNFFIDDNFLLHNKYAEELYHTYAADQPIIDYHSHLSPQEIAQNRQFENLTELWISGDHYKWRAMRTFGVNETFITGSANDKEKFLAWARTVPYTIRNPLFHWTHLELKRFFGIDELLTESSAERIYEEVNSQLKDSGFSSRGLMDKMNVEMVCTTEDPLDSLQFHQRMSKMVIDSRMNTSFRPDEVILIEKASFNDYIDKLGQETSISIGTYKDLCDALIDRISFFHSHGCRISDHGLAFLPFESFTEKEIETLFQKKRDGDILNTVENKKYMTAVLLFLGEIYHDLGWVQQLHLGALRDNNSRMYLRHGPASGWDSIGDFKHAENLSKFLNALDSKGKLAKTILYNLNPADNEIFASMIGNFNDGSVKGKIQYGSAWWFLDQKEGITKQLNTLSNMGLISCFVGMLTDSRSFLSFSRHEYFRRILCNIFGQEMTNGELPRDINYIGRIVADISYNNAKDYFTV